MIAVERTFDPEELDAILNHPDIKDDINDDRSASMSITSAESLENKDDVFAFMIRDEDEMVGNIFVYRDEGNRFKLHMNMLKNGRGSIAEKAAKEVIQWMNDNTECAELVATIPMLYPNVVMFAIKMGWKILGTYEKSYQKNDKLHDEILLGKILKREELCQQPQH